MLAKLPIVKCFLLFILVFGFGQITNALGYVLQFPEWLRTGVYFSTQILLLCISILFIRTENSSFRGHGFLLPEGAGMYVSASVFLALLYIIITIFLPGSLTGFEAFPTAIPPSGFLLVVVNILLASTATETIFRGYIQTNFTKAYGFFTALLVNSVMSTLYLFPLSSVADTSSTIVFYSLLSLFAESIFLSIFFAKTKTLLCTATYSTIASLLYNFTPVKAITTEYAPLILVITYVFLAPLMYLLVLKIDQILERT